MIAIAGFGESDGSADSFFFHNRQREIVSFHLSERKYFLGLLNGFLPEIGRSLNNIFFSMRDEEIGSL